MEGNELEQLRNENWQLKETIKINEEKSNGIIKELEEKNNKLVEENQWLLNRIPQGIEYHTNTIMENDEKLKLPMQESERRRIAVGESGSTTAETREETKEQLKLEIMKLRKENEIKDNEIKNLQKINELPHKSLQDFQQHGRLCEQVDERTPVQETNKQATFEEQLKTAKHEPGSVQKTKQERVKPLRRQLNKHIQEFKQAKYAKEMEKAKLAMEREETRKLQEKLQNHHQVFKNTIEQFRDLHLGDLQRTGKLCAYNCVLCTILWTCQRKLGFYPCGLQLLILLYHEVAAEIKGEDLVCHKLIMEIFSKCKIVAVAAKGEYSTEENAKNEVIEQAWERIMTTDDSEHVAILGKIAQDGGVGHAVVCDLDSRTSKAVDGTVTIYNPQRDENATELNQENFIDLVKNDRGLIIYRVDLERLNQIRTENPSILHHTCQPDHL